MARNGSGVYSLPQAPFVSGTTISSTAVNSDFSDIATALTQSIASDGQTAITANLPMSGYAHTNVANSTARNMYAATGQVQDGSFTWCGTAGGTADALTLTPTPAITAYATGQKFRFKAGSGANTGATTVAISGLTTRAVQLNDAALAAGDIAANKYYEILYDGTAFQLQRVSGAAATSIATSGVTFTNTDRILGRDSSGGGAGEELTLSAVLDFVGSAAQGDVLYRGAATWTRLGAGTSGQFLQTQGTGANPQWASVATGQIIHVRDEKTAGTAGGDFNSGAWRTRTLNTVMTNTISGASLSSNQVTLPAGTYDIKARGPINGTKQTKSRIYNTSDAADALIGATGYSHSANDTFDDVLVWGRITIASSKTFELQQWCDTTVTTNGFGLPANIDSKVEVYAEFWAEKVA